MATITTSIGTNSSLDTQTPTSGTGANPYTVTFGTDPTGVSVGDSVQFDNGMGTVYQYLVTEISGSDYTLKWITGGGFATNPYGIVDMSYSQASGVFQRTYSTISAWESDLDNTSYYSSSDDAVGEVYNDSVFDEYIVIDGGGTVGLSSVTLTVPESERHDGTAGTGARVEYTGSQSSSFRIRRSQCTVEWLELDLTSTGAAVSAGLNLGTNSTQDVYARNNIIHGLTTQSTHIHGIYIWGTGDSSNSRHVMNNLVYRIDNSSTTKEASGITVAGSNWGVYLYNNTVYYVKATGGGDNAFCFSINDTDTVIKNNIAARPLAWHSYWQKCFGESGFSGSTHDYNLSTDSTATGTNSVTGESYGDLFVSDTGGTEDLHLKEGADAIGAGVDLGTTPTGVNVDIDGRDRDAQGDTWDIGADQYVAFVLTVTPSAATVVCKTENPAVVGLLTVTPSAATVVCKTENPAVAGLLTVTPSAASSVAATANPVVVKGSTAVTPSSASAIAATANPVVVVGSITTTAGTASAIAATVNPSVISGSITTTPTHAGAVANVGNPTVAFAVLVIPTPAATVSSTTAPVTIQGSIVTTPSATTTVAKTINPSVGLSSVTTTPGVASSVVKSINPTSVAGSLSFTVTASAIASAVDPTAHFSSVAITPTNAWSVGSTVNPAVGMSSTTATPNPVASVVSATIEKAIAGSINITPTTLAAIASTQNPSMRLGSVTVANPLVDAAPVTTGPVLATGRWIIRPPHTYVRIESIAPTVTITAIPASGLEFTLPGYVMHYDVLPTAEFTLPTNRLHYTATGLLHQTMPTNRLHFVLNED